MQRIPIAVSMSILALLGNLCPGAVLSQAPAPGEIAVVQCWEYARPQFSGTRIGSDSENVFFGSEGARIDALTHDGKVLWTSELGGHIVSNLVSDQGSVYVVTDLGIEGSSKNGSLLRSLSKTTGIPTWSHSLISAEEHYIHSGGVALTVVSKSGTIASIDASTGRSLWRREITDRFSSVPIYQSNKLYIGSTRNQIFVVNPVNGEIELMLRVPHPVTSIAPSGTGTLFLGDERGNIFSLAESDSRVLWKFKSGGRVNGLYHDGETVFVSSNDNFIYSLSVKNGSVTWKVRLGGRPQTFNVWEGYVLAAALDDGASIIDPGKGRLLGRVGPATGGVIHGITFIGDKIFVLTDRSVRSYSGGTCIQSKTMPGSAQAP